MDLAQVLDQEWSVISAAPRAVATLTCAIIAAVWIAVRYVHREEINGLKAKLEAKDERLSLANDKAKDAVAKQKEAQESLKAIQIQTPVFDARRFGAAIVHAIDASAQATSATVSWLDAINSDVFVEVFDADEKLVFTYPMKGTKTDAEFERLALGFAHVNNLEGRRPFTAKARRMR
jgi:hypothetical protein